MYYIGTFLYLYSILCSYYNVVLFFLLYSHIILLSMLKYIFILFFYRNRYITIIYIWTNGIESKKKIVLLL